MGYLNTVKEIWKFYINIKANNGTAMAQIPSWARPSYQN